MASAKVRIEIVGGSQTLKELEGVRRGAERAGAAERKAAKEAEKAAKEQLKAAKEAEKASQKAAERVALAAKRGADAKLREEKRAADMAKRIADKAAKDAAAAEAKQLAEWEAYQRKLTDIAAREARKRALQDEKSVNARRKEAGDTLRRAGGVVGALGAGVVAGGASAMSVARSTVGVNNVQTRIQNANDFKERLILTAGQAGLTNEETMRVQGQVQSAALASGKMPGELMGVLEAGQAQFNDLKFFADNIKEISVMAKATGSDVGEFGRAMGFARQAFGLTGDEAMEAAKLMVAAANKGSIEVKDFAKDFAPVMGVFAQGTKMTGLSGFREMLGVSQAAGTLGAGSAETSTMVERLIAMMQNPERMKELKTKTGIDVKGKTPAQFIDALATNKKFTSATQADIFGGDIIANKAITALMSARSRTAAGVDGAIDIKSIANVDAATGADAVAEIMGRLENSGLLDLQRQAIEMENDTIDHLAEYNEQLQFVTEASNRLEKSFGTLSLWASSIGVGGVASTVGGAVLGGIGKAKAAATAAELAAGAMGAGSGGLLATLGTGVGSLGAGAIAGGVGLAAGAGVGAGMGIDAVVEKVAGKALSTMIGEWMSSGVEEERKRLLDDGRGSDRIKGQVELTTDVHIHDHRTEVKQRSKTEGNVSVGRGVLMPDSGL